ncbi:MAG: CDP-alcohol phosphatidyltransferase family protein [Pseudomonadota bacterium]
MRLVTGFRPQSSWPQPVQLRLNTAMILASAGIALAVVAMLLDKLAGTTLIAPSSLILFGGIAVVLGTAIARHHPYPVFGAPNAITLLRTVMVCAMAGILAAGFVAQWAWAMVVVASVALILDGFDGWAARRSGIQSRFGARFDMEIDALCLLVLSAMVADLGKVGGFVLLIGLARYLFIAAGWLWPVLARPLPDDRRRKTICVVQGVVLTVCLAPIIPPLLAVPAVIVALALLLYSFAVDTIWLIEHRHEGEVSR